MKNKKPTMMEIRNAIAELINRTEYLQKEIGRTNFTIAEFISFKNDGDNFTKYLKNKLNKQQKDNYSPEKDIHNNTRKGSI